MSTIVHTAHFFKEKSAKSNEKRSETRMGEWSPLTHSSQDLRDLSILRLLFRTQRFL